MLPTSRGREPLIWFEETDNKVKLVRCHRDEGIKPASLLLSRDKQVKFFKLPISRGMEPLIWFEERDSKAKLIR